MLRLLTTLLWTYNAVSTNVLLSVNSTKAVITGLTSTFLSVNIDTASIAAGFDFGDPILANLLLQIAPVLLRIGGSAANGLRFTGSRGMPCGYAPGLPGVELSTDCWNSINNLLAVSNTTLLFDFSAEVRQCRATQA